MNDHNEQLRVVARRLRFSPIDGGWWVWRDLDTRQEVRLDPCQLRAGLAAELRLLAIVESVEGEA